MKSHTVIVASEEPLVEIGARGYFQNDPDFELVAVCGSTAEVMRSSAALRPDVVVWGLALDADLASLRQLQRVSPHCAIVLWTRGVSLEVAHLGVALGVRGFISTASSLENFGECLRTAARGEMWMEHSLTMGLLASRPVSLSKRQNELVGLLVQGLKNKEIAGAMGISEGTVKAYLTTLYEKVGARDRFELALFGLKNLGSLRGPLGGRRGEPRPALVTQPQQGGHKPI
ncbi:MAG TPA: response regulator transcription factor [Bryobacteraceae bacterium]|nr:response regulator transcription factor [Bryobacteraceae bacterium]